jgi:hypothetical protein
MLRANSSGFSFAPKNNLNSIYLTSTVQEGDINILLLKK